MLLVLRKSIKSSPITRVFCRCVLTHPHTICAQVQYSHLGQDAPQDNRQVFRGGAFMVSGAVTSMAGADRQHWDEGVFSYTPFYISFGAETGPIDPTLPCEPALCLIWC